MFVLCWLLQPALKLVKDVQYPAATAAAKPVSFIVQAVNSLASSRGWRFLC